MESYRADGIARDGKDIAAALERVSGEYVGNANLSHKCFTKLCSDLQKRANEAICPTQYLEMIRTTVIEVIGPEREKSDPVPEILIDKFGHFLPKKMGLGSFSDEVIRLYEQSHTGTVPVFTPTTRIRVSQLEKE